MQLSVSLRVEHCRALVPSGFIHLCAWLREGNFVHLCTLSVCENTPSWHGQYLSCFVIASAAILQLCCLPPLRSGIDDFLCILSETGNWRSTEPEILGCTESGENEEGEGEGGERGGGERRGRRRLSLPSTWLLPLWTPV